MSRATETSPPWAITIKRLTRPWAELVGRSVYESAVLSLMHRSPMIRSLKAASRLTHGCKPYLVLARIGCRGSRLTVTTLLRCWGGQVAHGGAVSLRKGSIVFKQVHFLRAEPSGNDLGLERDQRVQRPHHTEDNCHALTAPWTDLKLLLFLRARARCPGKQVALIGV